MHPSIFPSNLKEHFSEITPAISGSPVIQCHLSLLGGWAIRPNSRLVYYAYSFVFVTIMLPIFIITIYFKIPVGVVDRLQSQRKESVCSFVIQLDHIRARWFSYLACNLTTIKSELHVNDRKRLQDKVVTKLLRKYIYFNFHSKLFGRKVIIQ